MTSTTRNKLWRLHSLLGIFFGLPLFVIFLAGSFAFFEGESVHWTHADVTAASPDHSLSLEQLVAEVTEKEGGFEQVIFRIGQNDRPVTDIYWLSKEGERSHYWSLPVSGKVVEATDHDFDYMHFLVDLHYFEFFPYGRIVAGIVAALFFSIIITGMVYQWRGLKKDFRWSRLRKTGRSFWKNWHRTLSALTMPFQIIYSVTGAVFALGLTALAPAIFLFFEGDQKQLEASIYPVKAITAEASSSHLAIDDSLRQAEAIWGDEVSVFLVSVIPHKDKDPTIVVEGREQGWGFLRQHYIAFAADGTLLQKALPGEFLGAALIEGVVNIHFGILGAFWIKLVFALVGIIVAFSIAAGVLILLTRYRNDRRPRWVAILELLTYWIVAGFPLAIAVGLFFATVVIEYSVIAFWWTLVVVFLYCFIRNKVLVLRSLYLLGGFVSVACVVAFSVRYQSFPLMLGSAHQNYVCIFALCILGYAAVLMGFAKFLGQGKALAFKEQ